MLKKLLTCALFAGVAAGVVASILHFALLVPIIIEAERYETGQLAHFPNAPDEAVFGTVAGDGADTVQRGIMTFGAELINTTGLALLMVALFAVAEKFGQRITARAGVLWGLAGFLAFHVAPAAGLPPETPGIPAGDLVARQIWWIATVLATSAGLAMLVFGRNLILPLVGAVLILAPHLVGAPHLTELSGVVPPSLEGLFVGRSLATTAVTWAVLGLLCGYFWNKQATA